MMGPPLVNWYAAYGSMNQIRMKRVTRVRLVMMQSLAANLAGLSWSAAAQDWVWHCW